jgi:O-methyltransferase
MPIDALASRLKGFVNSRWIWFVKGLPEFPRARAMFLARNHTMTQAQRCRNLWDICRRTLKQNVPGALVECGVWRGGSVAIMGLAAEHLRQERPLHLFDSFEGLPEPGSEDGAKAVEYSGNKGSGRLVSISRCEASVQDVQHYLFEELRLKRNTVHFHVGWFQDTVPPAATKIGPIAVLRLDGDWYASTQVCLENLYPLLSPGGVLILDDYNCWEGCKKATDEYRAKQNISAPIVPVDGECCYWVKP